MIFATCFLLLLISIICFFVAEKWKVKRMSSYTKHFNGPPSIFFIGNFFIFAGHQVEDFFKIMISFHTKYGKDVVTWGIGNFVCINITDPKSIETVLLSKTSEKSMVYSFIEPWLGTGLLLSKGEKWFTRRKILTPAFHFKILDDFIQVFNKQSDIFIEKLEKHVGQDEFDVYENVTLCALDSICETSMGISINAQENPDNEYVRAVKLMSTIIFTRAFSLLRSPLLFYFTKLAREQKKVIKTLHAFTNSVIIQRKSQLSADKDNQMVDFNVVESNLKKKEKLTFLDLLLKVSVNGKPLSIEDIREEVDTFMFEGHDTTTSGIAFSIYHLAMNQDVQEKLYEEINHYFPGNQRNTELTFGEMQELKYLDMVIKESMRLSPPVPIIGRTLNEHVEINGTTIPPGTDITIPIFALHRDPDIWDNPDKFDPERFNDEAQNERGPYDYIPFSAGQRNCIGQRFALLEMKTLLIKLLLNYKIIEGDQTKFLRYKADLVLRPIHGVPIKIVHRI